MTSTKVDYSNLAELDRLVPVLDWSYGARNGAQCLLPNLYLGSQAVARSLPALRELGVTHIICVRDPVEGAFVRPFFETYASVTDGGPPFQYRTLDFSEKRSERILKEFSEATQFCREVWRQAAVTGRPGVVLIHCLTGIEAGAAVAIGVVMELTGMSCRDATQWVKEYKPILEAQHVAASDAGARRKRIAMEEEEGSDDMGNMDHPDAPATRMHARLR
ncbi:protein-tyrosine phosphatase-like protein [Thamnocephalis sphaerospora]|uniref:Protein-tyrosine phosphatase-like protein n=1 Tax=Thamnocephalis sphaerospora TaxID=78915 RepID=A0A4P9XJW7_9FUNG|nr:protein-tyrosine phosphatase-like protein [Thamnocephalis sphaerospora]|eukprot:RKP06074.1 protein-tyrosine phosphatase-like protein [Thamnocephalis sphaerospora]